MLVDQSYVKQFLELGRVQCFSLAHLDSKPLLLSLALHLVKLQILSTAQNWLLAKLLLTGIVDLFLSAYNLNIRLYFNLPRILIAFRHIAFASSLVMFPLNSHDENPDVKNLFVNLTKDLNVIFWISSNIFELEYSVDTNIGSSILKTWLLGSKHIMHIITW